MVVDMDYRDFSKSIMMLDGQKITKDNVHVGIGSSNPEIIFVSEKSSMCDEKENRWCFISNESSQFFKESLEKAGISEYYITGCNKIELDTGDENHMFLKLELELLKPKIVVALGRKAEKILLKVKDITPGFRWFEVLPHPSFWLRFYSHEKKEYVNLLKDLKRKIDLKKTPCL